MSYQEQNVNLSARYDVMEYGSTDFMNLLSQSIIEPPSDYTIPASFIYYNCEVLDNDAKFTDFLSSLSYEDSLANIKEKYQTATGKSMVSVVADWENWLKNMNSSTDIYIER